MIYKLSKNYLTQEIDVVVNLEKGGHIPFDPANTDYQAYLAWLDGYEMVDGQLQKTSEGNTPLPADES